MSLLLLLLLALRLPNHVSSKETVNDDLKETMNNKSERVEEKMEELEKKLEAKNVEVENLQKRLTGVEEMLSTQNKNRNQEAASLKTELTRQCKAEVRKELDKVLRAAVEQGLRELPYEMVCAFQDEWREANSVVSYDRITVEFNNSDQPGGGDGSMNIETGVFTTITSGHYIITFSGFVDVHPGQVTEMWLHHNGVKVEESEFQTSMHVGASGDYIWNQGSRTVVSTVDL